MTRPLRSAVILKAHGITWTIAPSSVCNKMREPVLSPQEVVALRKQIRRWNSDHPRHAVEKVPRDFVRGLAAVKRAMKHEGGRAIICEQ